LYQLIESLNNSTLFCHRSAHNARSSAVAGRPLDASCHWIFR